MTLSRPVLVVSKKLLLSCSFLHLALPRFPGVLAPFSTPRFLLSFFKPPTLDSFNHQHISPGSENQYIFRIRPTGSNHNPTQHLLGNKRLVMSAAATAIAASLVRAAKECCDGSCSSACKQQPAPGYERCAGGFDVLPGQVHPWHQPAMPSHEAFHQNPTRPVIVTANPIVSSQASPAVTT